MHKPASTHFPLIEPIRNRWSSVIFDEKPIEAEKIGSLFEAARWAASSFNDQPWSYIVATKAQPDVYNKLLSCLMEANQVWAKKADLLAVAVANLTSTRTGKTNRHAQHDVGQANANLVLQATALGLASHQMGGFSPDRARELFEIPAGYEPLTMLAIGYPGETKSAAADLQSRDSSTRSRRPLTDWVFTGTWGTSSSLVE
ncbi:MAG: nitroreductase family protein [Planctomycetota bacterium]|nr:nitroreductase family protein [Planctomycetota bacterium]MDA1210953.1 nitroreductase family protein [Planctomycetota bacterium]